MALGAIDPYLYQLADHADQSGGLQGFDVNAASQNLAAVGQPMEGPPASVVDQAPAWTPVPGQPEAAPVATPMVAPLEGPPAPGGTSENWTTWPGLPYGGTPDWSPIPSDEKQRAAWAAARAEADARPVTKVNQDAAALDAPAFDPLPTIAPPQLTGDPAKDVQLNIEHQRALQAQAGEIEQRKGKLAEYHAALDSKKADKDAEIARVAQAKVNEENARALAERKQRQELIDQAVQEHANAAHDLEGANWYDKHTGAAVVATIFGGIGQGFMNAAMIQSGHAPTAENEAVKTIDALIGKDYQKKKDRLANASDGIMQARHGFEDAAQNHRSALNDLDAEVAAKYKLVEKEAIERAKKMGIPDAQIATNEIVVNAQQKAAAAEGQIHDRQEGHEIQQKANEARQAEAAATNRVAIGNLNVNRLREKDAHEDRLLSLAERKAKDAAATAPGGGQDIKSARLLETQVKNFASEHQLPKLESASRKLDEVRSMLDSGNPVAAMSALMEYDAAAKGSSATESSMHAIQGHLGGDWERLRGAIERHDTGNFGPQQVKILRGAIDAGRKAFHESVEPIHQAFGAKFDYSKPGVAQAAGGLFVPLGYRGKTTPPATGEAADPRIAKARAAVAPGSAATDVQRKNAQAFLDAHGG